MKTFKNFFFLLNSYEKKRAGLLLIMIFIMALLDTIGVASIFPLVSVLTNQTLIETNLILKTAFEISKSFGIENNQQFIFFLGVVVFVLLIISIFVKIFTAYLQARFIQMSEYSIGKRLIEGYLHQPYEWFLSHNSSDLGKNILSEVQQVLTGINSMIEVIAKIIIIILLSFLLIKSYPELAFIVCLTLAGTYGFFFFLVRKPLIRLGRENVKNNKIRFRSVNESLSGIKEIKFGGLEDTCVMNFSNSAKIYAKVNATSQIISILPRYILEAVAIGGVLLIILHSISQTGNLNNSLPILSLYIFAGYRLMPAIQQVYSCSTQITFIKPLLNKLCDEIKNLKIIIINQDKKFLSFNKAITLKNIYYNYFNSSHAALQNLSLTIPAISTVGFIGVTGSGKTTLVDIILGLLEAKKGTLEVDGQVITKKNLRSWQSIIGYVPQHIYLSDDTIAANIAFGIHRKFINQKSIQISSKIANIQDFIDQLPKQYQTIIGERGVRLSGGQRQRIGIARALYHNPKVLIFDEATSALDKQTEKEIMDSINILRKKITIIIVAHRLSTLKNCDTIFKINKGQLEAQGTFEEFTKKIKF
jgi:ABC-type multidrug transport system fused ATPase/permease subunit